MITIMRGMVQRFHGHCNLLINTILNDYNDNSDIPSPLQCCEGAVAQKKYYLGGGALFHQDT